MSKSVCKNHNKIEERIRILIHFVVLISFIFSYFTPQASVSGQTTNLSSTAGSVSREYQGQSLVEASYSNGTTYEYEYDPVGNRTAQIVDGVSTAYLYDAADRLTSAGGTAFTWDDNGNLLSDGEYSYAYDAANRLLTASGQGQSYGFAYDGLGNRYQQTVGSQTSTYTLDLAGSLSQVLYDGKFSYYYGLGRIAQQQGGNTDYFLSDALGSVRQIANSNGTLVYRQNFDPFGDLIGSEGDGGSSYGYAGEWTDGTGLQNLRARYYAPQQGRFTSTDPFPGMMSQPATLNPYSYVINNPVQLTDPSGEIAPILIAAGLGGLVGAGIDIGVQLYNMRPSSLGQALRCMNWGKVGISFASGAVAGLTGFITFSGITTIFGSSLLVHITAGVTSGVIAGQYGRLTGSALSGQMSEATSTLFQPQDILTDAVLGGIFGGVGYWIGKVFSNKAILNNIGKPYPNIEVPEYGKVPFPNEAKYTPPNLREPRSSTYRSNYIDAWNILGKPEPSGGWASHKIHHIQPLEYGGTNDLSNLVHLSQSDHMLFTQWWVGGYGPK